MEKLDLVRVRFAPAPTGFMHLGNVRTALMNFLLARQKGGAFVLRVEDTDPERNIDKGGQQIIKDLAWLDLGYDEGPVKEGPYAPYFQSERSSVYADMLKKLEEKGLIYRCFCTTQELEKKRLQQIALKRPPRYDKSCLELSPEQEKEKLEKGIPFIWRMKVDPTAEIEIFDMARGSVKFDLQHFTDFPLTRQDGSFTFIFANFVDDALMKINYILRGEDHLSNSANQAILYKAFGYELPTFWHLPILCSQSGKKLSKRDFGFSLLDLKNSGFLPEAIINYLAIIGGGKFDNEIMSLSELIKDFNFDKLSATGQVRYDVEKLTWLNHKWIDRLESEEFAQRARPFIQAVYSQVKTLDDAQLADLLQKIKTDLTTLNDAPQALSFYFTQPTLKKESIDEYIPLNIQPTVAQLLEHGLGAIDRLDEFISLVKKNAKEKSIPLKILFMGLRLALTGKPKGPSVHDILDMLGTQESELRLKKFIQLLA